MTDTPPPKRLENLPIELFSKILKSCNLVTATCLALTNKGFYEIFKSNDLGFGADTKVPISLTIAAGPGGGVTMNLRRQLYGWMTAGRPELTEWHPALQKFCTKQTILDRQGGLKAINEARKIMKMRKPVRGVRAISGASSFEVDAEDIMGQELVE